MTCRTAAEGGQDAYRSRAATTFRVPSHLTTGSVPGYGPSLQHGPLYRARAVGTEVACRSTGQGCCRTGTHCWRVDATGVWELAGSYSPEVRWTFDVEVHTVMTVQWSSLIGAAVAIACEKANTPTTTTSLPPGSRVGHYVASIRSASGDGSAGKPWDLATAFNQPVAVQAGDTIWLRAGTYRGAFTSRLTGTASAPIIVRQYPGERATIDGNLVLRGAYTWYWGFEVMSSVLAPQNLPGIDANAPAGSGTKLINLIVHDAGGNGISDESAPFDVDVYGSIIYNNGRQRVVSGYAHGIYVQSDVGTKVVSDNFLFDNLGFDLHAFGTTAPVRNIRFLYNVGINTATQAGGGWLLRNDINGTMENILFQGNMIYGNRTTSVLVLGPNAPAGRDLTFVDNYVWGGTTEFKRWTNLRVTGNTFTTLVVRFYANSPTFPTVPAYVFDSNNYVAATSRAYIPEFDIWLNEVLQPLVNLTGWQAIAGYDQHSTLTTSLTGKPSTNQVFVRPNQYEAGRANIVIYNWQQLATVPVDVSGILRNNDQYEVRNVQDFLGAPVLRGTYLGGTIAIPMTAVTPPVPLGGWPGAAPPPTGPEYNAFVVQRTAP